MPLTEVIRAWIGGRDWFQRGALATYLNKKLNQVVPIAEIEKGLRWLQERDLLEVKNDQYRLCEYDPAERTLYDKLEMYLAEAAFTGQLGLKPGSFVFQNTATGGARGDGRLAQPDFTMAAIQTWKFDPVATLEVFSFEVKNRAGTSVASVYEALAHGRYVNYPYLVYPYSHFDEKLNKALRATCEREGVGLISFEIVVTNPKEYSVKDLTLIVRAERGMPNPFDMETFLQRRLSENNCERLMILAKDCHA